MTDGTDRRTDHARRRQIELLIARVRTARAEIIDRGLDAVHVSRSHDRARVQRAAARTQSPRRA